ncbi:MAG: response regulator [Ideonella sp.]|nr:response regulator [Ideonella sp.]
MLELEPDLRVVGEFGDADSALDWLKAQAPQAGAAAEVMVLDLSMPGRSGLDLLRRVTLRWPSLRVLMFNARQRSDDPTDLWRPGRMKACSPRAARPTELIPIFLS